MKKEIFNRLLESSLKEYGFLYVTFHIFSDVTFITLGNNDHIITLKFYTDYLYKLYNFQRIPYIAENMYIYFHKRA